MVRYPRLTEEDRADQWAHRVTRFTFFARAAQRETAHAVRVVMRTSAVVLLVLGALAVHARADWEVTRDPFDPNVVAAYKAILSRDPHDPALGQLETLYRRYRSLDQLKREYEDKPGWADLVVMGRLQHDAGDDGKASDAWALAVAVRPDDARTWLLVGQLAR